MPMSSPLGNFFDFFLSVIFPFQLRSREQLVPIPKLLKPSRVAVILSFFPWILLRRTSFEGGRSREEFTWLRDLPANRLAVNGPYESEYFRAIWLLQATVYLLFGVIHVDNFQLYKWFQKLMLGCLDYWHKVDGISPFILDAHAVAF